MEIARIDYSPFEYGELLFVADSTPQQKEVWLAAQFSKEASLAFNQGIIFELSGAIDESLLNQTIAIFCERFPLTKASFSPDGKYLCVGKSSNVIIDIDDQPSLSEQDFAKFMQSIQEQEANTPFDLTFGPLLRVRLIKSADISYLLVISHHIVCDGFSLGVMSRQIPDIYRSIVAGGISSELDDDISIEDFQIKVGVEDIQKSKDYWAGVYQELPSPYELPSPAGCTREARRTFNSSRFKFELPVSDIDTLNKLAGDLGCTFPLLTYGIFVTLIHRLTNHGDLVVGLPVSSRHLSPLARQFAHMVNILPFRHKVGGQDTFSGLMDRVAATVYEGAQYGALTLNELIGHLNVPYDAARVPLVPLTFNTNQSQNTVEFGEVKGCYDYVPRAYETFEIAVNFICRAEEAFLLVDFNSSLFNESFIEQLCESYQALALSVAQCPDASISGLSLLSSKQQEDVLSLCSGREAAIAIETLHEFIEAQVARSPAATAAVYVDTVLTYEELNKAANQIAHLLINEYGVKGQLVGICVERSEKMLALLLAVLKAGASYLPLDPEYPKDRIAYILDDANVSLLITETRVESASTYQGNTLNLDEIWVGLDAHATENPNLEVAGSDPCYVIYTSGSTGKPKGVQVAHRNVVNFLQGMAYEPGACERDKLLAVTTLSFDIAVLELYLPLAVGAQTHIASRETSLDGEALLRYLEDHGITLLQATPATWRLMLQSGWSGSPALKGLIGGEALPRELLPDLLPRIKELWNMYGPTETTVWSTCQKIVDAEAPIYIGRPIDNTQVYIVDSCNMPLPVGIPGELCIGGEGVTLGYLGKPELTAERFIEFCPNADTERVYKTGDLVRMHYSGELEYLNRLDNQVKIRGFRIELGEIEANLSRLEGINQCVVVAHPFGPSDHRLVAYVKMDAGVCLTATEMRKGLKRELPDYMIPQFFIEIDEVPLTPSGKVDRKSLPNPSADMTGQRQRHPPQTDTEIALAAIWTASLKIDQLDLDDFFFDIGGHSLLAAEVAGDIKRKFGVKIELADLLMIPFSQIAAKIAAATGAENQPDNQVASPDATSNMISVTRSGKKAKRSFFQRLFGR